MSDLTEAQHSRLDKLPESTKVVQRHPRGGPIVRYEDGRHSWINEHGHLKPVAKHILDDSDVR